MRELTPLPSFLLTIGSEAPPLAWESADGQSRLYQGDCFALLAAVPDASIDCIWTDPPYLLSNDGITCVSGRMVKVNKGDWDRSQGVEADHAFNQRWLAECYRVLKPEGTIWVSGTLHVYLSVGMAMMQVGFRILNDIIWEKPAPPPNLGCRCFTHATEVILWATKARKGKERYTFHYDAMRAENGGKQMKNVWRIMPPGKDEKSQGKHPTQKPLALIERCLRASTNTGDLILDPFAGSATTGVAALRLGRRFLGVERETEYTALAVKRLGVVGTSVRARAQEPIVPRAAPLVTAAAHPKRRGRPRKTPSVSLAQPVALFTDIPSADDSVVDDNMDE